MSRDGVRSLVPSFRRVFGSLHSLRYGDLLRCAHKRIINIMKMYVERKDMQLELIRFHNKYRIYSRLLFRIEEVNGTRVFTLGIEPVTRSIAANTNDEITTLEVEAAI